MPQQKIVIGADHAGFDCKEFVKACVTRMSPGIEFTDVGTYSSDSVDYPDFAHQAASKVGNGEVPMGIVICGSGNGVCITANKHAGVRAALCWTPEIAQLAREHNNANIICIPARFVSNETACEMVIAFVNTAFSGGRHAVRVDKIEPELHHENKS